MTSWWANFIGFKIEMYTPDVIVSTVTSIFDLSMASIVLDVATLVGISTNFITSNKTMIFRICIPLITSVNFQSIPLNAITGFVMI